MSDNDAVEGFCLKCREKKVMVGILLTTMGNGTPAIVDAHLNRESAAARDKVKGGNLATLLGIDTR